MSREMFFLQEYEHLVTIIANSMPLLHKTKELSPQNNVPNNSRINFRLISPTYFININNHKNQETR